ncbi:MAG: sugar nucleotide-binding protein, partial [Lachnospiraceae bacterium]|nr:sugar nucleotide-binding protein [Lachnospiraceae bacterium]
MNVLVTGITGQLGHDVLECLRRRHIPCIGAGRKEFDLTDRTAVQEFLTEKKPDAIIHCAAFTDVNRAEGEEALCRAVNVDGTCNLAQAAKTLGAKMLLVSTEYV